MDIIESAKRNGMFFHSSIPDVYSSVAIASNCDRYLYCEEPFVLPGTSPRSNGLSALMQVPGQVEKGSEYERFLTEGGILWSPDVPQVPLNSMIKLESLTQARKWRVLGEDVIVDTDNAFECAIQEANDKPSPQREGLFQRLEFYCKKYGKSIPVSVKVVVPSGVPQPGPGRRPVGGLRVRGDPAPITATGVLGQ